MNHDVKVFSMAVIDSGNKKQQISMDLRICLRSLEGMGKKRQLGKEFIVTPLDGRGGNKIR